MSILPFSFGWLPVSRQPAHSPQAGWIWCLRCSPPSRFPLRSFRTVVRHHQVSPEFISIRNCVPMAFTTKSPLTRREVFKFARLTGTSSGNPTTVDPIYVYPSSPKPTSALILWTYPVWASSGYGRRERALNGPWSYQNRQLPLIRLPWLLATGPSQADSW